MLGQQFDVAGTFSKRWQMDWQHIQTPQKILAKITLGDRFCQITIAGSDHSNVDRDRFCIADALKLALLQDP